MKSATFIPILMKVCLTVWKGGTLDLQTCTMGFVRCFVEGRRGALVFCFLQGEEGGRGGVTLGVVAKFGTRKDGVIVLTCRCPRDEGWFGGKGKGGRKNGPEGGGQCFVFFLPPEMWFLLPLWTKQMWNTHTKMWNTRSHTHTKTNIAKFGQNTKTQILAKFGLGQIRSRPAAGQIRICLVKVGHDLGKEGG